MSTLSLCPEAKHQRWLMESDQKGEKRINSGCSLAVCGIVECGMHSQDIFSENQIWETKQHHTWLSSKEEYEFKTFFHQKGFSSVHQPVALKVNSSHSAVTCETLRTQSRLQKNTKEDTKCRNTSMMSVKNTKKSHSFIQRQVRKKHLVSCMRSVILLMAALMSCASLCQAP